MTNEQTVERVAKAIYISRYGSEGGDWASVSERDQADPWGIMARAAIAAMPEPMRCAECDCGNPPHDCNWIKPGPYAAIREDKT